MKNNPVDITDENTLPVKDEIKTESGRRIFFTRGIGAALTTFLGLSLVKVSGQGNGVDGKRGNKILDALYSLKSFVSPLDKNSLQRKIKQLDQKINASNKTIRIALTADQQTMLTQVRSYSRMIKLDESKGVVRFQRDLLDEKADLEIGKIESELTRSIEISNSHGKAFLPNLVESLLNQAADLLDRTLADRNEFDDKAIKLFYLALELEEFDKLDQVLQKQIEAGLYRMEIGKAETDFDVQAIAQEKLATSEVQMEKLVKEQFSIKSIEQQQDSLRRMNHAGYFYSGYVADPPGTNLGHHPVNFGNELASVRDHVNRGALELNLFNMSVQKDLNEIQLRSIQSNTAAATSQKRYYSDKLGFEEKNLTLKLERDHTIRMTYVYKLNSLFQENGILNYLKRLIPLRERFENDFIQAYSRLQSAAIGVQTIYQFLDPLPMPTSNGVPFFDNCIVWARKAINHINQISQNQVRDEITISIRSLLTKDSFAKGMEDGHWELELNSTFFKNKYQIRILGVSLSLVGLHKNYFEPYNLDGCFKAELKLPVRAIYTYKDGTEKELNLSGYPKIPHLSIGAVYSLESTHKAEVIGAEIAGNLSPIGKWELFLRPTIRPFHYNRRRNGKVRKVVDLHLSNDNIDIDEKEINDIDSTAVPQPRDVSSKSPLFNISDFLDIKLNLHVGYFI